MSEVHMLCFDWEEKDQTTVFAISATDLISVASQCPFGRIPGLSPGILGLVLWSGKVLPVLDLSPVLGPLYLEKLKASLQDSSTVFLFSTPSMPGAHSEVAIALPVHVRSLKNVENINIIDLKILCSSQGITHYEAA